MLKKKEKAVWYITKIKFLEKYDKFVFHLCGEVVYGGYIFNSLVSLLFYDEAIIFYVKKNYLV